MTSSHTSPVAVVGTAAIMPEALTGRRSGPTSAAAATASPSTSPERWGPRRCTDWTITRDKTYSRSAGKRRFRLGPDRLAPARATWPVALQMDEGQRWVISALAPRSPRRAGRAGRSTVTASRSSSATRSAARSTTSRACGSLARGHPPTRGVADPAGAPRRRPAPDRPGDPHGIPLQHLRDHRGHDAR